MPMTVRDLRVALVGRADDLPVVLAPDRGDYRPLSLVEMTSYSSADDPWADSDSDGADAAPALCLWPADHTT